MHTKIKKTIQWMREHFFVLFLIFTILFMVSSSAYLYHVEELRAAWYEYPEQTYRQLEEEAEKIAEEFEKTNNPHIDSYETTLHSIDASATVTLEVSNYGKDTQTINITRTYSSKQEQIIWESVCLLILSAIVAAAFLIVVFIILEIIYFFTWLFVYIRNWLSASLRK